MNGVTATQCWQCDAELVMSRLNEPAPWVPEAAPPASKIAALATEEDDKTVVQPTARRAASHADDEATVVLRPAQPAPAQPAPAPVPRDALPVLRDAPPVLHDAPPVLRDVAADPQDDAPAQSTHAGSGTAAEPAVEPESIDSGLPGLGGPAGVDSVFVDSTPFAAMSKAPRRGHPLALVAGIAGLVVVVALAGYFGFRQGAVGERGWLPGSAEVMGQDSTQDTSIPTPVDSTANPSVQARGQLPVEPPAAIRTPLQAEPPAAIAAPPPAAVVPPPPAAVVPPPPRAVAAARTSARAQDAGRARTPAALPPSAGTSERIGTSSAGGVPQPAPVPGPCTQAVAALGLCTPEPNARRP